MRNPETPKDDFCLALNHGLEIGEVEHACIHNYVKRLHAREMTEVAIGAVMKPETCTDLPDMQHECVLQLPLDSYAVKIIRLDGVYTISYVKYLETYGR